ncbi:MAG: hypothetical protein COA94_04670 [Rickettsiales bacterium]|nr:MAG: hypothetical protein COA94_04670 [Rickettsiales bacterium]
MFIHAGENWNTWQEEDKLHACGLATKGMGEAIALFHTYEKEVRQLCVGCGYSGRRVDILVDALPTVVWICQPCLTLHERRVHTVDIR